MKTCGAVDAFHEWINRLLYSELHLTRNLFTEGITFQQKTEMNFKVFAIFLVVLFAIVAGIVFTFLPIWFHRFKNSQNSIILFDRRAFQGLWWRYFGTERCNMQQGVSKRCLGTGILLYRRWRRILLMRKNGTKTMKKNYWSEFIEINWNLTKNNTKHFWINISCMLRNLTSYPSLQNKVIEVRIENGSEEQWFWSISICRLKGLISLAFFNQHASVKKNLRPWLFQCRCRL